MSFHRAPSNLSSSRLFAKGQGALGIGAVLALACNGRLAVLEPPVDGAAGSGGSSSVREPIHHTGGSRATEPAPDAGTLTPAAEPNPCACASSPSLLPLGCGSAVSGSPLISDDGLTVTFDVCDDGGRCVPYRWTQADGAQALPAPVDGGTVSHLSPDGDVLVINAVETFGNGAIVYHAGEGRAENTPLRPYYASLSLGDNGTLTGVVANDGGNTELVRWARNFARMEQLGELPFALENVLLAGTTAAERIVGVNYGAAAANELFRWSPEGGLELQPADMPAVANGSPLALSRNGNALAAFLPPEGGNMRIVRWTPTEVTNVATTVASAISPLAISANGTVVAGSIHSSGVEVCQRNPLTCSQFFSAFRWTESEGVHELTPGFGSTASVLSADGALVVGQVYDGAPALFYWTAQSGARNVRADLEAAGVDLSGWELAEPRAIAGSARVVVGYGRCGTEQAVYRIELPQPN